MKKSDLKQLIKPIVKECIHEALIEEGLLSNVVTEVVKGMQGSTLRENTQPAPMRQPMRANPPPQVTADTGQQMAAYRKKMADAVGRDSYNGANLFEGTEPLRAREPAKGATDLGDPRDAGVDISSLLGDSRAIWQAMK